MDAKDNIGRKKRRSAPPPNATLIWAHDGDELVTKFPEMHPAYLLQGPPPVENSSRSSLKNSMCPSQSLSGDEASDQYSWVQWASTGEITRIPKSNISLELPPRRGRSKNIDYNEMPEDESIGAANDTSRNDNESSKSTAVKRKRLSLSKQQRLNWREYREKQQGRKVAKKKENYRPQQSFFDEIYRKNDEQNEPSMSQSKRIIKNDHIECEKRATSLPNEKGNEFVSERGSEEYGASTNSQNITFLNPLPTGKNTLSNPSQPFFSDAPNETARGVTNAISAASLNAKEIIEIDDDTDSEDDKVISISDESVGNNSHRDSSVKMNSKNNAQIETAFAKETSNVSQGGVPKESTTAERAQHFATCSNQKTIHSTSHILNPLRNEGIASLKINQQSSNNSYRYSHRSSAYIQHIAEACTLIMQDARWRTCRENHSHELNSLQSNCFTKECEFTPLFSSEKGDDLSAVQAFISLYDKGEYQSVANTATVDAKDIDVKNESLSDQQDQTEEIVEQDEIFERAIHLYSRMFHRKGPWFDMADLYARYYAPKLKTMGVDDEIDSNQQTCTDNFAENSKSSGTIVNKQQSTSFEADMSKSEESEKGDGSKDKIRNFFSPRSSRSKNEQNVLSKRNLKNALNHHEEVSRHKVALECLFVDIMRLLSMRLVRSFDSEYECGFVVGSVSTSNNGANVRGNMLSAEERREVLRRLGGNIASTTKPTIERTNETPKNEILAQMHRQKSVFPICMENDPKATKLLPVRKHVDHVLLRKLATKVSAMMQSRGGTPQKIRKSDLAEAVEIINDAWRNACRVFEVVYPLAIQPIGNKITSATRLCEAPLKTLRRCLRLFLCSTGGPGSMRGDGTNGWRSISDHKIIPPDSFHLIDSIPTDNQSSGNWHNVQYPGLSKRLGLSHFELEHCFSAQAVTSDNMDSSAIIFHSHSEFKLWEIGAEIRCNFDSLMEVYENERISFRRRQRELQKKQSEISEDSTGVLIDHKDMDCSAPNSSFNIGQFLLRVDHRRELVGEVLALCEEQFHSPSLPKNIIYEQIESDICSLLSNALIPSNRAKIDQLDVDGFNGEVEDGYISDNERALMTTAIICNVLLRYRITNAGSSLSLLCARPWLRHMSFDACLCYIIWDSIPIFERNGQHSMAVKLLRTILFGSPHRIVESCNAEAEIFQDIIDTDPLIYCILPRRNRGKACERFVIDLSHTERLRSKLDPKVTKKLASGDATRKNPIELSYIQQLCNVLLHNSGRNGSIPFCSLRNIARKLKMPLEESMSGITNDEMKTLNIRLCGGVDESNDKNKNRTSGYMDWSPKTDFATANALSKEDGNSIVGRRCAFVGWENTDSISDAGGGRRSLNVEELAIEEYFSGRLPQADESEECRGQWVGWHDEGGHVRALFRIMCLSDLLAGTDDSPLFLKEQTTVFLSPYQSSPHDLHVGCFNIANDESGEGMEGQKTIRGFYERRRQKVAAFLSKISQMDHQAIIDLLYESVEYRWRKHRDHQSAARDTTLQKDMSDLRTLSMIAVGIGGKGLASIFRCLVYDYRHYSGGLPDCLLARARYCNSQTNSQTSSVVDLGDWIGESFSKESVEEKNVNSHIRMLYDRDNEFLGCSKNLDGPNSSRRAQGAPRIGNTKMHHTTFPSKLELQHSGREVIVEIMFVEVKSANDRLDARQEDWLNVLDGVCSARVCKFENTKVQKKKGKG